MGNKGGKWKPVKERCTKFRCETDDGESIEFKVCLKKGKFKHCKGV